MISLHYIEGGGGSHSAGGLFNALGLTRHSAFTLAEVLITLGIIGVVAAMTLPTLNGYYKKQEIVVRLKKFYSTLNNALLMSVADNGDMVYWEYPKQQNNGEQMSEFVNKYLFPYFSGIKECSTDKDKSTADCQKIATHLFGTNYYTKKFPSYIFSDGGCFSILPGGSSETAGLMHIMYDINCLGKPNLQNRDIFALTISHGKSFKLTVGSASTRNLTKREDIMKECKNEEASPHSLGACGALIFIDGWEIKDDYPFKI